MQAHNIHKEGPGEWASLHRNAAYAKTKEEVAHVLWHILILKEHFFCLDCRAHFKENFDKFPPPTHNNSDALFNWTVEMHNKVNRRNGKPEVSPMEAIKYYRASPGSSDTMSICKKDCGHTESAAGQQTPEKSPEHKIITDAIQRSPSVFPKMTVIGGL